MSRGSKRRHGAGKREWTPAPPTPSVRRPRDGVLVPRKDGWAQRPAARCPECLGSGVYRADFERNAVIPCRTCGGNG